MFGEHYIYSWFSRTVAVVSGGGLIYLVGSVGLSLLSVVGV